MCRGKGGAGSAAAEHLATMCSHQQEAQLLLLLRLQFVSDANISDPLTTLSIVPSRSVRSLRITNSLEMEPTQEKLKEPSCKSVAEPVQ